LSLNLLRQLFALIEKEFGDKTKPRLEFPQLSQAIQENTLEQFTQAAERSIAFPGEDGWSYNVEKDSLSLEIERELSKARESQLKLFLEQQKVC
jgi:hypothetical protein